MANKLEESLGRAAELVADLEHEYQSCLRAKNVTPRALELTHEVFEKYRGILDRLARQCWDKCVAPHLAEERRQKARVYFPIAADEESFNSIMGRWLLKDSAANHSGLIAVFRDIQPFQNASYDWLTQLGAIANAGKHIDLIPQKKVEQRRVTVSRPGSGSVSYGPGVHFGPGVSLMGAPVDPATQRIVSTEGVEERIETWVSFIIDGHGVNAIPFTRALGKHFAALLTKLTDDFNL